jgi:hypothetical protein
MSAGTLHDTDRLPMRERCESDEHAMAEDYPIASAPIPGYGTE